MKLASILAVALGTILLSSQTNKALSADLTFDASYYYYEEPNFMSDTSDPVFLSLGLRDWDTPVKADSP